MEVILTQDVVRLGKTGQVVRVKNGYARNFLFPKSWAVLSTPKHLKQIQNQQAIQNRHGHLVKEKALELVEKLSKTPCRIGVQVGEQGKLHGAVTVADILLELEKQGIALQKHQVDLPHPIAQLGTHSVSLKLHPEVVWALTVELVQE